MLSLPGITSGTLLAIAGQSTLVTLTTGAGKSLCYQLAAYMYAERSSSVAVVICPLVSLMEDQVSTVGAILAGSLCFSSRDSLPL